MYRAGNVEYLIQIISKKIYADYSDEIDVFGFIFKIFKSPR